MAKQKPKLKRKEIQLPALTIKALTKLASLDNRKLKPYMEKVLIEHASSATAIN